MVKLFIYLLLFGAVLYFLSKLGKGQAFGQASDSSSEKKGSWFRSKKNPREVWIQVYETESVDEGRILQARLQEQEVDCVLYEKGKKDIHGNAMKGLGVAVPKTAAGRAQTIISRMPV